jgi:alpha-beta hydrolase superfamily lysophospholipase
MKQFSIIAVHGLYSYHIYFADLLKFYTNRGHEVKTYDLAGFGKTTSSGKGDVESFNVYVFQLVNLILEMKKLHPANAIVVVGENIGGLVTLLTSATTEKLIDVLVAVNPVTDAHFPFTKASSVGHYLGGIMNPGKHIELKIAPEDFCDDEKYLDILKKDDNRVNFITFRFWMSLLKATVELKKQAHRIRSASLIQVSKSDKNASARISKEIFFSIGTRQKHFQVLDVPESMSICKERELVFEKQLKFIDSILNPPVPTDLNKFPEIKEPPKTPPKN